MCEHLAVLSSPWGPDLLLLATLVALVYPCAPACRIFVSMNPIVRTLFVAWQEPESRRIFPIARLTRRRSGEYEFAYIEAVRAAQARGFVGLPGLEDIERVHVSAQLPALFENRSASRGRPRSNNVEAAGLSGEALDAAPITVFVRRAPGAAPERLEAFSAPLRDPAGRRWGVFDVRGVGRVPAQRCPGGHVAARARHQRAPGGQRALEGRTGRGRS